jgi:hypothetical protein
MVLGLAFLRETLGDTGVSHYKPGLALELNPSPKEREKINQEIKRMNTVICFTEVRFQRT